jgi:hypothetical protein
MHNGMASFKFKKKMYQVSHFFPATCAGGEMIFYGSSIIHGITVNFKTRWHDARLSYNSHGFARGCTCVYLVGGIELNRMRKVCHPR